MAESGKDDASLNRTKNRITWLNDLRPGTIYHVVAQYGSNENSMFVMEVEIDEKVFQGIGPSRKKGKTMAAEYALVYLGELDKLSIPPPDPILEPYCWDDFSADIADSTTLLYYDFSCVYPEYTEDESSFAEGEPVEQRQERMVDFRYSHLVGKNTLAIIKELRPDAEFVELSESLVHGGRMRFVMVLELDGMQFTGVGHSKKIAKGRAARDALRLLFQMEFGVSDDGMPLYDGDSDAWLEFKAELERNADSDQSIFSSKHPVQRLHEYFPLIKFEFQDPKEKPDIANFFICQVMLEGETYEGIGMSKKEAKNIVAETALVGLGEQGVLARLEEAKRADKEQKKKADKEKSKDWDQKRVNVTASVKIRDKFPDATFELIGEKPFKKHIIAFLMSLTINEKTYLGVGKSKKMAKLDAAEKALKAMDMWTKEDEAAKQTSLDEEWDDEVYQQKAGRGRGWGGSGSFGWGGVPGGGDVLGFGGGPPGWNPGAFRGGRFNQVGNPQFGNAACGFGSLPFGYDVGSYRGGYENSIEPMLEELSMLVDNLRESCQMNQQPGYFPPGGYGSGGQNWNYGRGGGDQLRRGGSQWNSRSRGRGRRSTTPQTSLSSSHGGGGSSKRQESSQQYTSGGDVRTSRGGGFGQQKEDRTTSSRGIHHSKALSPGQVPQGTLSSVAPNALARNTNALVTSSKFDSYARHQSPAVPKVKSLVPSYQQKSLSGAASGIRQNALMPSSSTGKGILKNALTGGNYGSAGNYGHSSAAPGGYSSFSNAGSNFTVGDAGIRMRFPGQQTSSNYQQSRYQNTSQSRFQTPSGGGGGSSLDVYSGPSAHQSDSGFKSGGYANSSFPPASGFKSGSGGASGYSTGGYSPGNFASRNQAQNYPSSGFQSGASNLGSLSAGSGAPGMSVGGYPNTHSTGFSGGGYQASGAVGSLQGPSSSIQENSDYYGGYDSGYGQASSYDDGYDYGGGGMQGRFNSGGYLSGSSNPSGYNYSPAAQGRDASAASYPSGGKEYW